MKKFLLSIVVLLAFVGASEACQGLVRRVVSLPVRVATLPLRVIRNAPASSYQSGGAAYGGTATREVMVREMTVRETAPAKRMP